MLYPLSYGGGDPSKWTDGRFMIVGQPSVGGIGADVRWNSCGCRAATGHRRLVVGWAAPVTAHSRAGCVMVLTHCLA